jgi:hypothetical protein
MNELVTIEAELRVKGSVKSKEWYFILEAKTIPLNYDTSVVGLTDARGSHLLIGLGGLRICAEATIFSRVIEDTWPTGLQGNFVSFTANSHMNFVLVAFGGDDEVIRADGNMTHVHHVVSVEESGQLVVKVCGSIGGQARVAQDVCFDANVEALAHLKSSPVVWDSLSPSRIRLMCDDLMLSHELRDLCY